MVPMGYLLTSTVQASTTARQRQAALQLADSWMEIRLNNLYRRSNPHRSRRRDDHHRVRLSTLNHRPRTGGTADSQSTLAGTTFVASGRATAWQPVNSQQDQSDLLLGRGAAEPRPPGGDRVAGHGVVGWPGHNRQSVTDSTNIAWPIVLRLADRGLHLPSAEQRRRDRRPDPRELSGSTPSQADPGVRSTQTSGPDGGPTTCRQDPRTS